MPTARVMIYQGRIENWNDARGFGYVRPEGGGERAFVHMSACRLQGRRPDDGLVVRYRTTTDGRGRLSAADVRLVGPSARTRKAILRTPARQRSQMQRFRFLLGLLVLTALGTAAYLRLLPLWLSGGMLGLSALAFLQYGWDKIQARAGRWRTPESTLQLTALAGGWPGALLAQALLHHKSSKRPFQWTFCACVAINTLGVAWLIGSSWV